MFGPPSDSVAGTSHLVEEKMAAPARTHWSNADSACGTTSRRIATLPLSLQLAHEGQVYGLEETRRVLESDANHLPLQGMKQTESGRKAARYIHAG
jgi:hypothetical protein